MAQTSATSAATSRTLKQQFTDVYTMEHATTLKVLNAFPADKGSFKPHERSNSALNLAWTFVIENKMAEAARWSGLVFFCNPNNPTATVHPADHVADFVKRVRAASPDTMILIDEAYHD